MSSRASDNGTIKDAPPEVDDWGLVVRPIGGASESTLLDILAAIRALDSGVFSGPFTGINGDTVTINAAMPVAQPTTTLKRAVNDTGLSLATVIGVVVVGGDITMPVRVVDDGPLTLPTGVWDAVTGQSGGLTPGARYYLASTLGGLTTTPTTTPGEYVTVVGFALTPNTFLVNPQPPILL